MDLNKIRQDTIGCSDKIFLNSAGASLMPGVVVEKMIEHLRLEEQFGGYYAAELKAEEINKFYIEAGKLINSSPQNIAFAYNATDAYSRALSSIAFKDGDYILTTNDDYVSNQIAFISLQKKFNIKILRVRNLDNNDIDLNDFEELIKKYNPKLVAVTHIPTNSGLIQDVESIGAICKKYDILYLVDACQSVGQLEIDVKEIGCDFLSVTGRKFLRGPRGTGFLYISDKVIEDLLQPLFIDMRGADWIAFNDYDIQMNAKRFESWEFPYASLIGFTEAIRYTHDIGIDEIQLYNKALSGKLREGLAGIKDVRLLDKGSNLGSIITFEKSSRELDYIKKHLLENKIAFSVSYKNAALIDFTNKQADWAIRLSPHYFNTMEEIEKAVEIIAAI